MPAVDDASLRRSVAAAAAGDQEALSDVVATIRDDVYRLALRMLWHPADAEDATQEVLIKVITRLESYRGEAAFTTWVYRVTSNHLLNVRQSRVEQEHLDFSRFGEQLEDGLADPRPIAPDDALLAAEVKLGCTLGMLLCLHRDQRLAYVFSDVFQLSGDDGAYICSTTPAAFRKRASRARVALHTFTAAHCGLVDRRNACRCPRRIDAAVRVGRVDPNAPLFAGGLSPADAVQEMETLHDLASLMRSHPDYRIPDRLADQVQAVIDSDSFRILD